MQLEQQNIEMARKLLEKAIADLDEKFQSLPKDLNEITLGQVGVIMESYDFVNYLRNIIVNQLKYLEEESDQKESMNLVTKMYENWFTAMNDKINGYTESYAGNSASQTVTPGGYYEKMQQIKKFFDRKLKDNNLSEIELLKIQSAINLARKIGAGRHLENKRMRELFAATSDALFLKLPVSQKEKERSLTKSLIQTGRLDRSITATTTSVKSLERPNISQAALSKADWKKENEDLLLAMLQAALAKLSIIAELPQKKIEWLQFLQEQYKDLLTKDKKIAEQINDMNLILEMEAVIESKNLITVKINKLDKLVTKRGECSQAIIDKYHRYNELLTVEIANQIIDKDRELFKKVNIEEILKLNNKDPSYKKVAEFNNKISHWVAESILQSDINVRILAYERMINIASICYEQGDFNGAIAVIFVLGLQSIFKLKSTFKGLSPTAKEKYDFLTRSLDIPQKNNLLRQALSDFDGDFLVPYIGMYNTYLDAAKESNRKWFEDDRALKGLNTLTAAQNSYYENVAEPLSPNHDFYDYLQSSENYGKDSYAVTLLELSAKYEPNDDILNTLSTQLQDSKIIGSRVKSIVETNKSPFAITEMYFNESQELIIKYDELIKKYNLLQSKDIKHKLHTVNVNENYTKLSDSLDSIDNYINLILRQILSTPSNTKAVTTIAYIINTKYSNLILQLSNSQLDEELKRNLTDEKNNFVAFINELQKVAEQYVQNAEQRKLRKQAKTSISTAISEKPVVPLEPEIQLSQSMDSSVPSQKFTHMLPVDYLDQLRSEVADIERRIEGINKSMNELEQGDEHLSKIAKLSAELKIYETDLTDCRNILKSEQNILISQISAIANLPVSLDDKQAMVIICNFSALLNEDYDQSAKQLEVFKAEVLTKLQKELSDFKTKHDQLLINAISQLSLVISCLENKLSSAYNDALKSFMESYRALCSKMESSKELADYYGELNKFINASKMTHEIKSESQNDSPAPPPPDTEPASTHASVIPEIEDLLQSQVRTVSQLDEIIRDSRPSSVSSTVSRMSEELESNIAPDKFKHKESSSAKDIAIWASNRDALFILIYTKNYEDFNRKVNQLELSENFKIQLIEIIFKDLKNKNSNTLHSLNYQDYINKNILKITQSELLASHYDLLHDYIKNVVEKNAVNANIEFQMPENIATLRFFENTFRESLNIIHFDKQASLDAMKNYLAKVQLSDQLTNSQKLEICEKLFNFIKENIIIDAKNNEVPIYKENTDEDADLFKEFLPDGRKSLWTQQIELIKLLKKVYVDIVSDAYDNKDQNSKEWVAVTKLAEKQEADIRKRGLVDFQNSNTPINISETGTRKKIKKLIAGPQRSEANNEIYQSITNLIVKDLNKIVSDIQKAQRENNIDEMKRYVDKYLGRRKFGILSRNYREDFIKIASENGSDEDNNPLLKLLKIAGPELRKAIEEAEIMESHFWKGHASSQKLINNELKRKGDPDLQQELNEKMTTSVQQPSDSMRTTTIEDEVRATPPSPSKASLTEFKRYSDAIKEQQETTEAEVQGRLKLLNAELDKIKSIALKNFWLQQIRHVKIGLMAPDQFLKALNNFIIPMVRELNDKYSEDNFPKDYSLFKKHIDEHKKEITVGDSGILWSVDIVDSFNEMMLHYSNLKVLANKKDQYEHDLREIVWFFESHMGHFGSNPSECESEIKQLSSGIEELLGSVELLQLQDEKLDEAGVLKYQSKLKPMQELHDKLKKKLSWYKLQLENIKNDLQKANLNDEEKLGYQALFDPKQGVQAQLSILEKHTKELEQIEKKKFAKLMRPLQPSEEKSILQATATKLKQTLTPKLGKAGKS